MAVLTTLDEVKAVAGADANIQALHEADVAVVHTMALADKIIKDTHYGTYTKEAQTYYVAHLLSLATTEAGGRGPLSSETIGGVTQSWTLPYLNQQTVIASTQYGLMFLELRKHMVVPVLIVKPT